MHGVSHNLMQTSFFFPSLKYRGQGSKIRAYENAKIVRKHYADNQSIENDMEPINNITGRITEIDNRK